MLRSACTWCQYIRISEGHFLKSAPPKEKGAQCPALLFLAICEPFFVQRHPTKCFWYFRLRTFDAFALERKATSAAAAAAGGFWFGNHQLFYHGLDELRRLQTYSCTFVQTNAIICLPYPTLLFATYHVLFDFLSQLAFWEPLCFLHGKKLSFLLISSISPGIQQRGTGGLSPGRSWSLLQGLCFPPDHSGIHGTGRWHHQWRWNRTDVPTKTANVGQTYQKIAQTMWHDWCNMSQEDAFWEWFCMPLFWGRRHQVWTEHISWIFHQVVRRAIDLWTVLCGWSLYSTSREGQHSIHGQQWSQHEALVLNSMNLAVAAPLG